MAELPGEYQFIEAPPFPAPLAYGAKGGPQCSTDMLVQFDGSESRNRNWYDAMCIWDVGSLNRTRAQIGLLLEFFYAVARGQLYGFRFTDFTDYQFSNEIGEGDGTTQAFQLVKVYSFGTYTFTRTLKKPRPGTLRFTVNGIIEEGYDINFTTGLVTFLQAPPTNAVILGSGEFDVPVRFRQDHLPITRLDPNVYSCDKIELMEIRLPDETVE